MNKKINKHTNTNRKSFLILPIIYFMVFYLTLFLIFSPFISTISSFSGLLFSDNINDYSKKFDDIYKPVNNDNKPATVKKDNKEFINIEDIEYPKYGNKFGEFIIEDCNIKCSLFFGDNSVSLRNGVGIYNGSFIPGYGGTIMVSGHNNTYFNGLKNAEKGQIVTIKTSYGVYKYKIRTTKIVNHTEYSDAYDLDADKENLIMYTCYPFDELGLTTLRYFVYADYVSGVQIDKSVKEDK